MYQIGAFSKICQVSVKTLRHYDRLGLLKPAEVDRFTGYRYYDRSQLERMLLIQRLKRYGFSLEEIMSLLLREDDGALRGALRRQKDKLERQRMEIGLILQDLALHLESLEKKGKLMDMHKDRKIELKQTPARPVLSTRQRIGVDDFGRYYGKLYERISRENIVPDGVVGAMYHDEEFHRESSDIELFVGVRDGAAADKVLGPGLCASTVHLGPYSTLPETYGALVAWIEENGYAWDGAPYEIYRKTAQDGLPPQAWETEIYFPVKEK